jgi:ABC-type multidrug transport system ATPase subunit
LRQFYVGLQRKKRTGVFVGYDKLIKKKRGLLIMLEVSHVTKKYGKNIACNDVSFTLEPGSLTVLLGPNGAGKSTIIKSIIGFLKYQGSITVNGVPNKSTQARRVLGYIPEMPSLYPTLTVVEHMEFIARAYKLTDYKPRIDMLLERFELADKKKKFGDELSKGMQQKLNLCIGLLPDPDILLLDEPLLGLDPHAIKELKNYIEEMRQAGKTMLISTHIIDSVDMLWDRTIIMQGGQVKANVLRSEIDGQGKSLEDLFFEVTEGVEKDAVSEKKEESEETKEAETAEATESEGEDAK